MNIKMESEDIQLLKSQKPFGSQATSEEYEQTLVHLIKMASTQGWKDHAWHRAKELDANPTGLWRGIANDLVKIMKEKNAKTEE
jgi:hypothetical protein